MHEYVDYLNLSGIILEIIGFALLLTRLKNWIQNRYTKIYDKIEQEGEGAPVGASDEIIENVTNRLWNHIENFAIPLVIFGLFFQGLAIFLHGD